MGSDSDSTIRNGYWRSGCRIGIFFFPNETYKGPFSADFVFLSTVKLELVTLPWVSDS